MEAEDFPDLLRRFTFNGEPTRETVDAGITCFINEYWTAGQRQAHRLHEVSYRACFKPALPAFFIDHLTRAGDTVYDPFSGRGTTALQAALSRRHPVANDVNPLSAMLLRPRLEPVPLSDIARRLREIPTEETVAESDDLTVFFHPVTLRRIRSLRAWLLSRRLDAVDRWIRMVALNRLTGHSPGFFSVYTLPPNQATSLVAQRKINEKRGQAPPTRDVDAIILKKSRVLLSDGAPPPRRSVALLLTGPADRTPGLPDNSVDLVVTSPPFLDIVDYEGDNWLRCWFAGIDPATVKIDRHKDVASWETFVRSVFLELARVTRPGAMVAFEVGEVRGGRTLLERHVIASIKDLPFAVPGVMINQQSFTKTANCWGIDNNMRGTNSNRIVLARRL
jgi:DNA methylase